MMPEIDGFTLCAKIRQDIDVPILFLTAKTMEQDIIDGFAFGADDYIKKPFAISELRARVHAHLRREKREHHQMLVQDNIRINLASKTVTVNQSDLALTKSEYAICEYLVRSEGRVYSLEQILEATLGYDCESDISAIRVHIKNIRFKFSKHCENPIETVWGVGYIMEIRKSNRNRLGSGPHMGLRKTKKETHLISLFIKYLVLFCILVLIVLGLLFTCFWYSMKNGVILPANYAERTLEDNKEEISNSQLFDRNLIPHTSSFAFFDHHNKILETNMNSKELNKAIELLDSEKIKKQSMKFERNDGTVIVHFDLLAHFPSEKMHELFPKPELTLLFMLILVILLTYFIAIIFSKRLKRELNLLVTATNHIKNKELDFEVEYSNIYEFNSVLVSVDQMKVSLKKSLEEQWKVEENKKNQISALTHDIKTPLTVIKGNTELLLEANNFSEEDNQCLNAVYQNSVKLENYMNQLQSMTFTNNSAECNPELYSLSSIIVEIKELATALCKNKSIRFEIIENYSSEECYGDKSLMIRGLTNILSNAVDYSCKDSEIICSISESKETVTFSFSDSGKGFSKEALKNATKQFYTEREARSENHYGMGLFIAQNVAALHNGKLIIVNGGTGANVSLVIKRYSE